MSANSTARPAGTPAERGTINAVRRPLAPIDDRHGHATRLLHAALGASIVAQLGSSLLMIAPLRGHAQNVLFEVHEYSGLAALALAAAFWVTVAVRRCGTPVRRLLPWFDAASRTAIVDDAKGHVAALRERRVPPFVPAAPLASAVHGLGLLLVTAMAATGLLFYVSMWLGRMDAGWATLDLEVHKALATLVWAYLIGHAGMALSYRWLGRLRLADMWSLRADRRVP